MRKMVSIVYFEGKKKSVEDGQMDKESYSMNRKDMTGRDTDRQGVWWVPGAYVNTRSPLKQEDIALIRGVVRDARLEWRKDGNEQ